MTTMTAREPRIDRTRVSVGGVYDMTVRFGSQSRTKCRACTCYLSVNGSATVVCGRCATAYEKTGDGRFKVVRLP